MPTFKPRDHVRFGTNEGILPALRGAAGEVVSRSRRPDLRDDEELVLVAEHVSGKPDGCWSIRADDLTLIPPRSFKLTREELETIERGMLTPEYEADAFAIVKKLLHPTTTHTFTVSINLEEGARLDEGNIKAVLYQNEYIHKNSHGISVHKEKEK